MSDATTNTKTQYVMVTESSELTELIHQWEEATVLAVDTEFMRTHTFFAEPGLIQIADEYGVYLIDPTSVTNIEEMIPFLENEKIIKIMHSMSEDVGLLYHSVGAHIKGVFDTQIAAAFLGIGVSPGYQNLVSDVLGIQLDKGETRSDWLQRPLSDSQLQYAALDVIYLQKLYKVLQPRLHEKGYLSALFEEATHVVDQIIQSFERPDIAYLKLRGGWELSEYSQKLLKALVIWRDQTALSENIPKPWVFNDAALIDIANLKPKNVYELKRLKGLKSKSYKRFSEMVVNLVGNFDAEKTDEIQLIDPPIKGRELQLYRKLKSVVAAVSKITGMPDQLLGSRKMLENLVIHCLRLNSAQLSSDYLGWRYPLLGEKFEQILQNPDEI